MCVYVCDAKLVTQNVNCSSFVYAFLSQLVCSIDDEPIIGFLDLIFVTQLLVRLAKYWQITYTYMYLYVICHAVTNQPLKNVCTYMSPSAVSGCMC